MTHTMNGNLSGSFYPATNTEVGFQSSDATQFYTSSKPAVDQIPWEMNKAQQTLADLKIEAQARILTGLMRKSNYNNLAFLQAGYPLRPVKPSNPRNKELYKTALCDFWSAGIPCRFGERCWFAHGPQELRIARFVYPGNGSNPYDYEIRLGSEQSTIRNANPISYLAQLYNNRDRPSQPVTPGSGSTLPPIGWERRYMPALRQTMTTIPDDQLPIESLRELCLTRERPTQQNQSYDSAVGMSNSYCSQEQLATGSSAGQSPIMHNQQHVQPQKQQQPEADVETYKMFDKSRGLLSNCTFYDSIFKPTMRQPLDNIICSDTYNYSPTRKLCSSTNTNQSNSPSEEEQKDATGEEASPEKKPIIDNMDLLEWAEKCTMNLYGYPGIQHV